MLVVAKLCLRLFLLCSTARAAEVFVASQCGGDRSCCRLSDSPCNIADMDEGKGNSTMIFPGGETRCIASTSTDYAFQVYKGRSDRILVYFQGGGSCWDDETTTASLSGEKTYCFTDALPWLPYGFFDVTDPRNSYSEYTIVNILYCSGDNHVGNVTREYTDLEGGVIQQTGAANVDAVLQWIQSQQINGGLAADLTDLVVSGCSSGSLAAQVWGNEIVRRLGRPARSAVVLDSYAGYFPGNSEAVLMYEFGACGLYFLSADVRADCMAQQASLSVFMNAALNAEPDIPYMFLQSRYDQTQINYYNYIVNSPQFEGEYSETNKGEFAAGVDSIFIGYDAHPNFLVYFVSGDLHCFTPRPFMFNASSIGYMPLSTQSGHRTEFLSGFDFGSFDFSLETLMKWVFRAPLLPGEVVSTVCSDNDVCATSTMGGKVYQQSNQISSGSYTGSSSKIVAQLKALPRYDSALKPVVTDFNISKGEVDWVTYGSSIIPLPAIIYSCGVFAVLIMIVVVLLVTVVKAVVYNLTKSSEYSDEYYATEEGKRKVLRRAFRYMNLTNTMYCLLFVAFISNIFIIIGNVKVSSGVSTTITTLDDLDASFSVLIEEANDLEVLGSESRAWLELTEEACPDYAGISDTLNFYDESVNEFSTAVSYVPGELDHFYDYINEWGVDNRNYFVWILFVVLNCIVLTYALSTRYSSKFLLKFSIFFSILVILLSFAFAAVYMISLMLMSDFCSDPVQFTLQLAPKDEYIQSATIYYLSCEGRNPNFEYTYEADYSVRWVNFFIQNAVSQNCPHPSLQHVIDNFYAISDEHIVTVEDFASCQQYHELWINFVDDGVCTDTFGGVYIVWIAQTVTAICLFLCTIVGIRLIPLLEKIDRQKFGLLDDSSTLSNDKYDGGDSSHHSVELAPTYGHTAVNF